MEFTMGKIYFQVAACYIQYYLGQKFRKQVDLIWGGGLQFIRTETARPDDGLFHSLRSVVNLLFI